MEDVVVADAPPIVLACLAMLTLAWPVAAWQTRRFWRHETTFFDVAAQASYRRARSRTMPVVVFGSLPFLASGWTFVADPPVAGRADAAQVLALVAFVVSCVLVLGVGPSVLLFNRPRWAVPPHLRRDYGYLRRPQRRQRRSPSVS